MKIRIPITRYNKYFHEYFNQKHLYFHKNYRIFMNISIRSIYIYIKNIAFIMNISIKTIYIYIKNIVFS